MTISAPIKLIAFILLASMSALPARASSSLSTIAPGITKAIPGVISYEIVPASAVPQGATAVQGFVVSLGTTTEALSVYQPVVLTVTIANISSALRLLWEPNAPCSYTFAVTGKSTGETNIVKPLECTGDLYSPPIERLSPGMATRLTFKVASSELASVPDRYTISVRSFWWYPGSFGPGVGMGTKLETLRVNSNQVSIVIAR